MVVISLHPIRIQGASGPVSIARSVAPAGYGWVPGGTMSKPLAPRNDSNRLEPCPPVVCAINRASRTLMTTR